MIQCYFLRSGLVLSLLLWSIAAFSQDIEWEKSYGGKHADYLFDALPTADYGFILAGSSLSRKTGSKTDDNNGDLDYWLWKMDEKGDLDWQRSYGGSGSDFLQCIQLTPDGGFILGGHSESEKGFDKTDSCKGKSDYWIIKLDAKGGEQWQKTIGGNSMEQLKTIINTRDGGYLIGGSSNSDATGDKTENSRGNLDYWLVKLDSKGSIEWQKTLGGKYADVLKSLIQTADGGFLAAGSSNSPTSEDKTAPHYGLNDYWLVKLDEKGELLWERSLGGEGDDQLQSVLETQDGQYLIGGHSNSGSTGNKNKTNRSGTDIWLVKMEETGKIIWQETYHFGKVDLLSSIVGNEDGTFLLGGHAKTETFDEKRKDAGGINDYIFFKIKADGELLWKESVGSKGEDLLSKAIAIRDGGYLLAGTSKGEASGDKNASIGGYDFWVVKIKDKDKPKEDRPNIEAMPNPTMQFTNVVVGYDFEKGTCSVYDLSGRQVQSFPITERIVPVDLGALPIGVYIISIETNVQQDGVKVIKGITKN
jgi:hypothetical protein